MISTNDQLMITNHDHKLMAIWLVAPQPCVPQTSPSRKWEICLMTELVELCIVGWESIHLIPFWFMLVQFRGFFPDILSILMELNHKMMDSTGFNDSVGFTWIQVPSWIEFSMDQTPSQPLFFFFNPAIRLLRWRMKISCTVGEAWDESSEGW